MSPGRASDGVATLRDRIREEATRLFADRGYAGTSIREVALACDCTKPALYYYFDNKDALFQDVVEHHLNEMDSLLLDWIEGKEHIRQRTHNAVDRLIGHAAANPDAMRLLQRLETSPEEQNPDARMCAARELHLKMVSELAEQGIASGQLRADIKPYECALVLAGALSFQFELSFAKNVWDRERIHRTIDLIFDGISA